MLFALYACSSRSDFKAHQQFVEEQLVDNETLNHQTLMIDDFQLGYVSVGNPHQGIVLWLHGTPGSWKDAGKLLVNQSLLKDVMIVTLDRPGWGNSFFLPSLRRHDVNKDVASFDSQSYYISSLVTRLHKQYPNTPIYLAGHSWGASLAPRIALDNLDLIDGMVLVAGTHAPQLAKPRWYHHLARRWPFKNWIGDRLIVANNEMHALPAGVESHAKQWSVLSGIKTVVMQGKEDPLVDYKNVDFVKKHIEQSVIILDENYGHFWHVQRSDDIALCILAVVNNELDKCEELIFTYKKY